MEESGTFDATLRDGINEVVLVDAVKFTENATPIVTEVNPKIGDFLGGYNLTITGTNLNTGSADVEIDGITCQILEQT